MLKYFKKYWIYFLLAPFFMLGEVTMELLQPDMMASIVDEGVLVGNIRLILDTGVRMILWVVFGGVCGLLCGVLANIAAQRLGNNIRKEMFSRVMDFSFGQTNHFTIGSLVTRITNDVTQVENLVVMAVRSVVRCFVSFAGGIYMLWRQFPSFAIVSIYALPLLTVIVALFLKKVSPLYMVIQKRLDQLNCIMQENIKGARVVKAYVKEETELEHFSAANDALCSINLKAQSTLAFLQPCVNIILNLCVVLVLYVSGINIQNGGSITPGQTIAAITYLSLILMKVIFMANIFQTFTRASASWKRIREVLETEPAHTNGSSRPDAGRRGEISFRNVSFFYPDAPENVVLKDISFDIHQGETVAIIGATGCGKTTLANLIPRFYDATEGAVLVDGLDVKDYSLTELRDKIGFVQQKAELFSRSIGDNIRWGRKDAGEQDIRRAAETAQAADFIQRMPEDYDTMVSEGGHSLSGGQKQRVSIARTLLKKPEILIFDDSTSALDLKTEAALHQAFERECSGTTRIIIAQRIVSIKNADRIIVLENGRINAIDTHQRLLQTCYVYRDICCSQLKKEVSA